MRLLIAVSGSDMIYDIRKKINLYIRYIWYIHPYIFEYYKTVQKL